MTGFRFQWRSANFLCHTQVFPALSKCIHCGRDKSGNALDNRKITLLPLGNPENAKISTIQYLCCGDKCWYSCRPITATFRKYIFVSYMTSFP